MQGNENTPHLRVPCETVSYTGRGNTLRPRNARRVDPACRTAADRCAAALLFSVPGTKVAFNEERRPKKDGLPRRRLLAMTGERSGIASMTMDEFLMDMPPKAPTQRVGPLRSGAGNCLTEPGIVCFPVAFRPKCRCLSGSRDGKTVRGQRRSFGGPGPQRTDARPPCRSTFSRPRNQGGVQRTQFARKDGLLRRRLLAMTGGGPGPRRTGARPSCHDPLSHLSNR